MRGSVGIALGASGDMACLADMFLLGAAAGTQPASGGAYTRNAPKREF